MLCYPLLWYGMESIVCYEISMLCYEIPVICYAMIYVVKDKHSATVTVLDKIVVLQAFVPLRSFNFVLQWHCLFRLILRPNDSVLLVTISGGKSIFSASTQICQSVICS